MGLSRLRDRAGFPGSLWEWREDLTDCGWSQHLRSSVLDIRAWSSSLSFILQIVLAPTACQALCWHPGRRHEVPPAVTVDRMFPVAQMVKKSTCSVGDPGSVSGSGRSPGEGNGNPLPWENPTDRGASSMGSQRVGHDWTTNTSRFFTSLWASQVTVVVKKPPADAGDVRDTSYIPGSGGSPGGGHATQFPCLENPMDRGAWWATVHRLAKSQTRLKWLGTYAHT